MHLIRPCPRLLVAVLAVACAPASGYRLADSGDSWVGGQRDGLLADLRERYPAYFEVILDPANTRDPDLRPVRDDLEAAPVSPHNYDALHAVAFGYFELNYRAETAPGSETYLADSFRAAKIVAVPWRAYGEIDDGPLRDAILDFFEDASSGQKTGTASSAPRLARVVRSLEPKEPDPRRRARIDAIAGRLEAMLPGE